MALVTIVYDLTEEDAQHLVEALKTKQVMEGNGAMVACYQGDAIAERDEALAWSTAVTQANKVAHLFNSGDGMMLHLQQEYGQALMALEKKKEPIGS